MEGPSRCSVNATDVTVCVLCCLYFILSFIFEKCMCTLATQVNMGCFGAEHMDWLFGTMDYWVRDGGEQGYLEKRGVHAATEKEA